MWRFNWGFWENFNLQTSQEYGFSPMCVCMWLFKIVPEGNADPQTLQEYGLTSLTKYVFACVFLNSYAVKMLTHNFYKKMSSVCVSILLSNSE